MPAGQFKAINWKFVETRNLVVIYNIRIVLVSREAYPIFRGPPRLIVAAQNNIKLTANILTTILVFLYSFRVY